MPVSAVNALAQGRFLREALAYWQALGVAVLVTAAVFFLLRSRRGVELFPISRRIQGLA